MTGDLGNDVLFGDRGDDLLDGREDADKVNGGDNNDSVSGSAGADTVLGDGGNDRVYGGSENDTLFGGPGKDSLYGGTGADRFDFVSRGELGAGTQGDTIYDFDTASGDVIDLAAIDVSYIGTAAFDGTETRSEVRFDAPTSSLLFDTDGDGLTDYRIALVGVTSLAADDMIA